MDASLTTDDLPSADVQPGGDNNEEHASEPPFKLGRTIARCRRLNAKDTLLLIDSRPLTRASVSRLLEASAREFRIWTVSDPNQIESDEGRPHPDKVGLILFNIGGASVSDDPVQEGIRFLARMLSDVPLIIVADRECNGQVLDALRAGVRGYIPTTLSLPVAIEALRLVKAGGIFIPPCALSISVNGQQPPHQSLASCAELLVLNGFTRRQLEVLKLLRQGNSNKVIAYELHMQESTVKVHVRHIMKKLKATNRTQAAFLASRLVAEEPNA